MAGEEGNDVPSPLDEVRVFKDRQSGYVRHCISPLMCGPVGPRSVGGSPESGLARVPRAKLGSVCCDRSLWQRACEHDLGSGADSRSPKPTISSDSSSERHHRGRCTPWSATSRIRGLRARRNAVTWAAAPGNRQR